MRGFPDGIAKSGYTIACDEEKCLGCGLCAKACNVEAMAAVGGDNGSKKKRMKIKPGHCLGCGACIPACPTGALTLVATDRAPVPEKKRDLFIQILKDKRRFVPYVVAGLRTRVRRALGLG